MDRFGEMETFARVVESGSFSRAARDLHMTPSAVSKMIGRLEDRLGVRLLSRTTRKLSLTEEGRAFYQRVTPILAEVEEAEETVSLSTAEARGVLKVNTSTAFGQYQVVPLIPNMLEKYPNLQVQLTMTDSIVNLVEEGFDVSIRIGTLTDSSLIARKLGTAHRVLVASPDYLKRRGTPTCPNDLKEHECLKLSIPTSLNKWEFIMDDGPSTVEVSGRFEADNAIALHEAALAGLGLFRAATFVVGDDIKAGRLVPVLQKFEISGDPGIFAVWPHNRNLSAKVRAFVDILVDAFSPIPPWERDN
ncbi:MAG: LysR family transcriptional regulator [Rhodospirillales bacterium]|nr:LysR family transcriptional regulator [Rhodospirillales bacterium]MBO6786088.1 LysR family transcriptional regulator [Rhodospirillales bacterium]